MGSEQRRQPRQEFTLPKGYLHHDVLKLYGLIDLYLAPSRFMQQTVKDMGFSGDVRYLPNFIDLSLYGPCYETRKRSFVYFGRLSAEKGVQTLITAVAGLDCSLKIIGDGPLRDELERAATAQGANNIPTVNYWKNLES
jgi:glycosyltransferase involved in cell wall biosynthesis